MSEQKMVLERSSTRKTLKHIKSDSASLIVHRDSASFLSRYSDSLSRLSVVFKFDPELFSTKVHERVHRKSLKTAYRQEQSVKNQEIEQLLLADKRKQASEIRILLISTSATC